MADVTVSAVRRYLSWVLLCLLLVLTWLLSRAALSGPFLFDDAPNLQNLAVARGAHNWLDVARYVFEFNGLFHRGLSALSFLIDAQDWPANPYPFKRTTLLLHLVCGVAVFSLARGIARAIDFLKSRAELIALLTAAAWLLHPMQLSTTMLVVQRMTILMALFSLVGLTIYIYALTHDRLSVFSRAMLMLVGLWGCGLLATLSKENGALITLYALSLDKTVLRSYVGNLSALLGRVRRLIVLVPIAAMAAFLAMDWPNMLTGYNIRPFTLSERLLTEARICFEYVGLILMPRISGTGLFHDDFALSRSLLDPPITVVCACAWIALLSGAVIMRRRWPLAALGVFWFVGGLAMESTIIPLELYFEHRNYLPMIGPLFALVAFFCTAKGALQRALPVLLIGWIALAAAITGSSSKYWGNEGLLATAWAAENPRSVRAQQLLADWYYGNGHLERALAVMDRATDVIGPDIGLLVNSVFIRCELKQLTDAHLDALENSLRYGKLSWASGDGLKTLASEVTKHQCDPPLDYTRLKTLFAASLANSMYQTSPGGLGRLHYEYGAVAADMGDMPTALQQIDLSFNANPDIDVIRFKAYLLFRAKRYADAMTVIDAADAQPEPLSRRLFISDQVLDQDIRTAILEAQANEKGATPIQKAKE